MKIEKTCPKCGYDDVSMRYIPVGKKFHKSDNEFELLEPYFNPLSKLGFETSHYKEIGTECILVTCRTCQYKWVSDTVENLEQKGNIGATEIKAFDINNITPVTKGGFVGDPLTDWAEKARFNWDPFENGRL